MRAIQDVLDSAPRGFSTAMAEEEPYRFSLATQAQRTMAAALGVFNFVGVVAGRQTVHLRTHMSRVDEPREQLDTVSSFLSPPLSDCVRHRVYLRSYQRLFFKGRAEQRTSVSSLSPTKMFDYMALNLP